MVILYVILLAVAWDAAKWVLLGVLLIDVPLVIWWIRRRRRRRAYHYE